MKPVNFNESNHIYAKDQPQYLPLPVYKDNEGICTSCWKLSWFEIIKLIFSRKLYIQIMTFNQPLQPQKPCINNPIRLK